MFIDEITYAIHSMPIDNEIINVDTSLEGEFIGYISVADEFFGKIYIPFSYCVYDEESIKKTSITNIDISAINKGDDISGTIEFMQDNGASIEVIITADMVSNYDNSKSGYQFITITCDGFSKEMWINVLEEGNKVTDITVALSKYTFIQNKEISNDLFEVTATINNGYDYSDIALENCVLVYDTSVVGIGSISITYADCTDTKEIKVISEEDANKVTGFTVGYSIKDYYVKDNPCDMAVNRYSNKVIYGNGYSNVNLTVEEFDAKMVSGEIKFVVTDGTNTYDHCVFEEVGEYTTYYTYMGLQSKKVIYNVIETNSVVSISLNHLCDYYCVNDTSLLGFISYELANGNLGQIGDEENSVYSNEITLPVGFVLDGFDTATEGDKVITISCDGVLATKTIHVYSEIDYKTIVVALHYGYSNIIHLHMDSANGT
ncbi:MAG: hypothetical protein WCR54_07540, partial [Clostridia bacterium]